MTRRRRIRYDPSNDLYAVLGVQPSASADDIRRSFRQQAKTVHPDHNLQQADWAHQQFQRLNEAYAILGDAALRSEYDLKRTVYHRHRGPDGLAWWERPNPRSSSHASGGGQSGIPFTAPNRRPAWNTARRKRRQRTRAYEVLFMVSALMLAGSLFAWVVGVPGRNARGTGNVAAITAPEASQTTAADVSCSDISSAITTPANGANVTGRFSIRGTAASKDFTWYTLEIALLNAVASTAEATAEVKSSPMITLLSSYPVSDGLLASDEITANLAAGDYLLRLTVSLAGGRTLSPCEVKFHHTVS